MPVARNGQCVLLGGTTASSPEDFFGFHHRQVQTVHYHKQGLGHGVFFRLHDSDVIDTAACRHESDPVWYDATTH